MKKLVLPVLVAVCGMAIAKLPAPDDATKAKAAEAAAKAAWQGKMDAYLTCKVQDKLAAKYGKRDAAGKDPAKEGAKQTADAKPAAATAAAAASAAASAASAQTTPVVAAAPPPCADPGPFAYNAPEQKPLETSGAHSPAGNATSPPSVRPESAQMQPAAKAASK